MKKRIQKPVVRIQNEKTKEKDRSRKHPSTGSGLRVCDRTGEGKNT
jgi:hypothetical protein